MAKKAELLAEAKKLKLDVSAKSTIKELEAAIAGADTKKEAPKEEVKEEKETDAANAIPVRDRLGLSRDR